MLAVVSVLLFVIGAKAESCVSGDGNCFPDGDAMQVLMQAKRTAAKKHVTSEMLASDHGEPLWSYLPNQYCNGNWESDWAKRTTQSVDECKTGCEASASCLGIVVGTYDGVSNTCAQCTSMTDSQAHGSVSTYVKRGWYRIICPVLGALFKAGDIHPDEDGIINKTQVKQAFLRVGISEHRATETTDANFDHLPEPKNVHVFNMDLQMDSAALHRNLEHDFSTGIRDGHLPSATKYKEFEQYIGKDGDIQNWSQIDVQAAIDHFKINSNDHGVAEGGITFIGVMLAEFANEDGQLSKDELKGLFLNSNYPNQFKARRTSAVAKWEEDH